MWKNQIDRSSESIVKLILKYHLSSNVFIILKNSLWCKHAWAKFMSHIKLRVISEKHIQPSFLNRRQLLLTYPINSLVICEPLDSITCTSTIIIVVYYNLHVLKFNLQSVSIFLTNIWRTSFHYRIHELTHVHCT